MINAFLPAGLRGMRLSETQIEDMRREAARFNLEEEIANAKALRDANKERELEGLPPHKF